MEKKRSVRLIQQLREMSQRDVGEKFDGHDKYLIMLAASEIESLRKSLSDTLDALDHAIYLVGPDANQIKGMTGAAEHARELIA